MGIGRNKIGMLGMMAAMALTGDVMSYGAQGKVGTSKEPKKEPEVGPAPLLGSLLIQDKDVPKGLTKETINFQFELKGYVMCIKGDICYTSEKRRIQRIDSMERKISQYVLGLQFDELLRRGEFEIVSKPEAEAPEPEKGEAKDE